MRNSLSPPGWKPCAALEQIYLGKDIVSDRRGTRSENVIVRPERASNELEILSPVSPSPDGP